MWRIFSLILILNCALSQGETPASQPTSTTAEGMNLTTNAGNFNAQINWKMEFNLNFFFLGIFKPSTIVDDLIPLLKKLDANDPSDITTSDPCDTVCNRNGWKIDPCFCSGRPSVIDLDCSAVHNSTQLQVRFLKA